MKRLIYVDGWHERGNLSFFVENGRYIRGVFDNKTVYPYKYNTKYQFTNHSGDKAYYSTFKNYSWL